MKKTVVFSGLSLLALLLSSCLPAPKGKANSSSVISDISSQSEETPEEEPSGGEEEPSDIDPSGYQTTKSGIKADVPSQTDTLEHLFEKCEKAYTENDFNSLMGALRGVTSLGHAGSYAQLLDTYEKCFVKDNGYMFDYYSNISHFEPGQTGSYKKEGDTYNREHSIPKSWWGGSTSNQGADPYIVVPTDGYINGMRNNYPFGIVENIIEQSSGGFSKRGYGKASFGYTGTVFEPDDSVKGDLARMSLYALAKYSESYSWTKDKDGYGESFFTNDDTKNFGFTNYAVKLLTYWNNLDKPDEWETTLNEKVSKIQGNRNPFVDHPEYVNVLWKDNTNLTKYE